VIKKFGVAYDYESHATRMIDRVRKWGFNSIGAFSPTPKAAFPYVTHLPINEWEGVPRIPGAHEVWDPFDAATVAKIAENIAREVPARANDPLLIGWFIVNEPRYDELPLEFTRQDQESSAACQGCAEERACCFGGLEATIRDHASQTNHPAHRQWRSSSRRQPNLLACPEGHGGRAHESPQGRGLRGEASAPV
jgi:hypothetical protein